MIINPSDLINSSIPLSEDIPIVELFPRHLDHALAISEPMKRPSRQWPCYIQALALLGFQDWLEQRDPEIELEIKASSTLKPAYANIIDAICNVKVGEFKVCLIPRTKHDKESLMIPRAILEIPDLTAHFYTVIDVDEDAEIAVIRGFLQFDEMFNALPILSKKDWNYSLSLTQLNQQSNELLLYLRCLDQDAIPLPQLHGPPTDLMQVQNSLSESLVSLQTKNLWDVMDWEEGSVFLRHPDMLELLYDLQAQPQNPSSLILRLQEYFTLLTHQAINTAAWLHGQLDGVAQNLGLWSSLTPSTAMRWFPLEERFGHAIDYIRDDQNAIPSDAMVVYQTIDWANQKLCLCSVAWLRPQSTSYTPGQSSWSLLLLLGTQNGQPLSSGTALRVSTLAGCPEIVELEEEEAFLYIIVDGTSGQSFVPTICRPESKPLTLSPYALLMEPTK